MNKTTPNISGILWHCGQFSKSLAQVQRPWHDYGVFRCALCRARNRPAGIDPTEKWKQEFFTLIDFFKGHAGTKATKSHRNRLLPGTMSNAKSVSPEGWRWPFWLLHARVLTTRSWQSYVTSRMKSKSLTFTCTAFLPAPTLLKAVGLLIFFKQEIHRYLYVCCRCRRQKSTMRIRRSFGWEDWNWGFRRLKQMKWQTNPRLEQLKRGRRMPRDGIKCCSLCDKRCEHNCETYGFYLPVVYQNRYQVPAVRWVYTKIPKHHALPWKNKRTIHFVYRYISTNVKCHKYRSRWILRNPVTSHVQINTRRLSKMCQVTAFSWFWPGACRTACVTTRAIWRVAVVDIGTPCTLHTR